MIDIDEIESITGCAVHGSEVRGRKGDNEFLLMWSNQTKDFGKDFRVTRSSNGKTLSSFTNSQILEGKGMTLQDFVDESIKVITEEQA